MNMNRSTKAGGIVGMFISSSISYSVRSDLNLFKEDILESISIETCLEGKDKTIIGTIYKPPKKITKNLKPNYIQFFIKINKEKKDCILMGDFNIDLLKYNRNNNSNRFIHQMYSSHFFSVIDKKK